eukprot:1979607-Alexandrium_andersonii.AAC.1
MCIRDSAEHAAPPTAAPHTGPAQGWELAAVAAPGDKPGSGPDLPPISPADFQKLKRASWVQIPRF